MAPSATEVQAFSGPRTWLLGVTIAISQHMKEKDAGKKRTVVELSLKAANEGPRKEKKKRPKESRAAICCRAE
jgi:hypothetical protein